ncbi:hypothetical protein CEP53_008410 [Fusarium sp. AF-6]|nr:hypothetical protein CEP53_008410 [Fusarium sp. AF-6]
MPPNGPHPQALFSLVPLNDRANNILTHHGNAHLVSSFCPDPNNPNDVLQGLEIGFHIRPTSRYTLAIIGRKGDIKLDDPDISPYHCSFERHERNWEKVMLQDRSLHSTTRLFEPAAMPFEPGHPYRRVFFDRGIDMQFGIGGAACDLYQFRIYWHEVEKHMIRQCIENRERNPDHARTVADEPPTSVLSLLPTKIRYSKPEKLGKGAFGSVRKVVNVDTGEYLAMKRVVRPLAQVAYARMRREVDLLSLASHRNIVELIASQDANDRHFEIFMPVKTGSVQYLAREKEFFIKEPAAVDPLLHQMLQALDCLDSLGIIHHDVKPDNILYTLQPDGKYLYQLADFGLANIAARARTEAGTRTYIAPELLQGVGQTTKMDIWSLYVTLAYAMNADGFREKSRGRLYWRILNIVKEVTQGDMLRRFRDMAIEEPKDRATAGDMLENLFNGEGRTTSQN